MFQKWVTMTLLKSQGDCRLFAVAPKGALIPSSFGKYEKYGCFFAGTPVCGFKGKPHGKPPRWEVPEKRDTRVGLFPSFVNGANDV